jgi:hypothetical protein
VTEAVTEDGEDRAREERAVSRARGEAELRHRLGDASRASAHEVTWAGCDVAGAGSARALERNPDVTLCFARIGSGPRRGELCERPAGAGTSHPGVGRCRAHGGETDEGRREASWVVGHAFARELDCTPWEALLRAVRIAAGRVAFIESKLATAECDEDLEPEGRLWHWVRQAEEWHDKMLRASRLAIDAGVAERLVRQLELEAELMLKAANMTLDELGLEADERQRVLSSLARNMLALEAAETGAGSPGQSRDIIEGEHRD